MTEIRSHAQKLLLRLISSNYAFMTQQKSIFTWLPCWKTLASCWVWMDDFLLCSYPIPAADRRLDDEPLLWSLPFPWFGVARVDMFACVLGWLLFSSSMSTSFIIYLETTEKVFTAYTTVQIYKSSSHLINNFKGIQEEIQTLENSFPLTIRSPLPN